MTGNTSKDVYLYEVRSRKDKRGVNLISDALPFGRLWYGEPDAISNVIGTYEHAGDFQFRILLSFQFSPFASKCSRSMRRAS